MSKLSSSDILSSDAVQQALGALPEWHYDCTAKAIRRRFIFTDFAEAFRFMREVAAHAEAVNHHPEWCNVWNRLDIAMTTHAAGGVTRKDFEFAGRLERIAHCYQLMCDLDDGACGGCQ